MVAVEIHAVLYAWDPVIAGHALRALAQSAADANVIPDVREEHRPSVKALVAGWSCEVVYDDATDDRKTLSGHPQQRKLDLREVSPRGIRLRAVSFASEALS